MRIRISLLAAALLALASGAALAKLTQLPAKDWPGSKDHPIVSRFAGSIIIAYEHKDYDAVVAPLGSHRGYNEQLAAQFVKAQAVEGNVTRIAYALPANKSTLEVLRNYEQALTSAGFKTLFTCAGGDGCGYNFGYALVQTVINRRIGDDGAMIDVLSAVGNDARHLTARLDRASGPVHVAVTVMKNKDSEHAGALVQIIEGQSMQTGQVTVDANAMATAIQNEGRIALYGITFETDSATITAQSRSTLAEMAKLLAAKPKMKAYVVGHTDNTGTLAHNLDLSQRRADAVVKALETQHGVAAGRLSAKGLASYAPVASNGADAGRARNRRVELVEQ